MNGRENAGKLSGKKGGKKQLKGTQLEKQTLKILATKTII